MGNRWNPIVLALVLCVLCAQAPAAEENHGEPLQNFQQKVLPAFTRLADVATPYAEAMSGLTNKDERAAIYTEFDEADTDFAVAVEANWPYALPEGSGPADVAAAQRALEEAQKFEAQEYHTGRAKREEAVARYLSVAEAFPHTEYGDLALFATGYLYLSRASGRDARDLDAARICFERAAKRDGPPSGWSLGAANNLAGMYPAAKARMEGRSQFYLDLEGMKNRDWLAEHLLTPREDDSPQAFGERVSGVLVKIRACQITNAYNMVADAVHTESPLASLAWLMERHKGDPLVEPEIRTAIKRCVGTPDDRLDGLLDSVALDEEAAPRDVAPQSTGPGGAAPTSRGATGVISAYGKRYWPVAVVVALALFVVAVLVYRARLPKRG